MPRDVFAGSRYDSVEKRFDGSTVVSPATATKRERGRVVGCWSCTRAFRPGDASSPAGAGRTPKREMRRIVAEIDWDRLHAMLRAPLEFVSNKTVRHVVMPTLKPYSDFPFGSVASSGHTWMLGMF